MIITKTFTFDSAHCLSWHKGKCSNLHGHTYKLEVSIQGELTQNGIVMDFGDLKKIVKKSVLAKLDHKNLNDIFKNPTAEIITTHICKTLEKQGLNMYEIKLWETPTSCAVVRRK